jgi:hypothetical protein
MEKASLNVRLQNWKSSIVNCLRKWQNQSSLNWESTIKQLEKKERKMSLEQDIRDSISKNLSAEMGAVLKERLEKAEHDEREVVRLKAQVDKDANKYAVLLQLNADLQEQLKVHAALDVREVAIATRERNLEITELQVMLKEANARADFTKDVALGLVRNIEYRQSVHVAERGRENLPANPGVNGAVAYPISMDVNRDTTTTTTTQNV